MNGGRVSIYFLFHNRNKCVILTEIRIEERVLERFNHEK